METRQLACVPVMILPDFMLGKRRCGVIKGVWVAPSRSSIGSTVRTLADKYQGHLGTTHIIVTDSTEYIQGVWGRLRAAGKTDQQLGSPDRVKKHMYGRDVAKHVLTSLALVGRFRFRVAGVVSVEMKKEGKTRTYNCTAYGNAETESASYATIAGLSNPRQAALIPELRRVAEQLDIYYRPHYWQADRFATALNGFWVALCSHYQDSAFIALTTVLESLLSTKHVEIAHTVSERVALLLGKHEEDRLLLYRQTKELYNTRSRLTHGSVVAKKGKQNAESLFVDAKHATVPCSQTCELMRIVVRVMRSVLSNKKLLACIQEKGSADKNTKKMDEYYSRLVFGGKR